MVTKNNDEAERRERQLNRLQQLQSRGVHSPTGTPADRRKSLSTFTGLTNQQLTEHYAKCIQLSAENVSFISSILYSNIIIKIIKNLRI